MESKSFFKGNKYVKELVPSDFDPIATWKLKDKECSIILFYVPWCPYCKNIKEDWEKLGKTATFLNVYSFNCEKYKSHFLKIKEDMPQLVTSYPTIIIYKNRDPIEFVEEKNRSYKNLLKTCMRVSKT